MVSARSSQPPATPRGAWRGLGAVVAMLLVGMAMAGESRVFMGTVAGVRTWYRGGSAARVVRAILQPPGMNTDGRTTLVDAQAWVDVSESHLAAPAAGLPAHLAALQRAEKESWITCQGGCTAAWERESRARPPETAVEIAILGADSAGRVDAAIGVARAAGLAQPEEPSAHARFMGPLDRSRMDDVERVLGLATLWELGWPLPAGTRITSPFGERTHPVLNRTIQHKGVDLAAATGTPLKAPADAVVHHVGEDTAEGLYVVLDHGHGVQSVSCHLSSAHVKRGDRIKSGHEYAATGASGRVTGPHLHYGVKIAGRFLDPVALSQRSADVAPTPPTTPRPAPAAPAATPQRAPRRR